MAGGAPPGSRDELAHDGAAVEEWLFTCWASDGSIGVVIGHRLQPPAASGRRTAWYWAAVARAAQPLLHVSEWDVPVRADPFIVKAHGLWAEHVCDAPFEQWTVANETYAVALDDPDEALGRAHGRPAALACDLEWYATGAVNPVVDGYEQAGVVHGVVELAGGPVHLAEVPAWRWHRWGGALTPLALADAYAHTGLRAPFAFPDGTVADWVLTPDGWRSRRPRRG